MTTKKDPAAQSLGRKRWKGKTAAEKTAHSELMNRARTTALSPRRRSELARNAARARWAKPQKKTRRSLRAEKAA